MMNKLAHGIVLIFLGAAGWFVWAFSRLPLMVRPGLELPAFTKFCMMVGPTIVIAAIALAAAYCLWVWLRKGEGRQSWVAFLATGTSALVLLTLPNVVATFLALINAVNQP